MTVLATKFHVEIGPELTDKHGRYIYIYIYVYIKRKR